jgi:acetoin utilization deacetylase AcuC-like enzyme
MTAFFYDPIFLEHETGAGHPERADRLRAIVERLHADALWDRLEHHAPRPATVDEITLVHPLEHVEAIRRASERGGASIDPDTVVSAASYEAAARAAGAGIEACALVLGGSASNAFCAVRPPGHHAETRRAMGFCLFNNIAVAARHVQRAHGLARVAIVDWDVHHGNGTQEIFERDPTVLYVSTHQHPLYPGTGLASETGRGEGEGFTLNIPMPSGSDDDDYRRAFERITTKLDEFRPELLLVSAGFDAHRRDPLASMLVTTEGFRWMMAWAMATAERLCDGRLVAMLEGGYDLTGLSQSVSACISEMLAPR